MLKTLLLFVLFISASTACSNSTECNGGECVKGICDCPYYQKGEFCSHLWNEDPSWVSGFIFLRVIACGMAFSLIFYALYIWSQKILYRERMFKFTLADGVLLTICIGAFGKMNVTRLFNVNYSSIGVLLA